MGGIKIYSKDNKIIEQLSSLQISCSDNVSDICIYDCEYGDTDVIFMPCIAIMHSEKNNIPVQFTYAILYPFGMTSVLNTINRILGTNKNSVCDMKRRIQYLLAELGLNSERKGTKYLVDAIYIKINGKSDIMSMKYILGKISEKYCVSICSAERNIRTAVESLFISGNLDVIYNIFGGTINPDKGKTTNYQFISIVAEKCRYCDCFGLNSVIQ